LKKEFKRQIKQDELVSGFERAAAWVSAHRDEARMTLGVVVVVGAIAAGLGYVRASRQREAQAAFAAAMEIFKSPVATEIAPGAERPPGTVYATANEKFKKAVAAFDGVERRYPSLAVGSRARYYAALSRIELGETADAEKALKEAAAQKGDGGLDSALARLALADLYRRSGQIDKAAQAYRDFAADSSVPFPRDFALMNLGSMLERARKLAEAEVAYRRVVDEFATGVYAPEARRRLAYLQTAIQG
jgi:tetratricopeptide (TPR) repeat protein